MRALSNVREKAMDEETKIDLISAILAAGSVNMPDTSRPPGSADHDGRDVVLAFRSIRKRLIAEGLDPGTPYKWQPPNMARPARTEDEPSG
jgi:hypothetical protein